MLSPFHVRWQTTMFNRLFAYCARINPRALYLWWGLDPYWNRPQGNCGDVEDVIGHRRATFWGRRVLCRRFNGGLVFGIVAMLGSVVLLIQTLQQTLAQMTTNNPRIGAQQALQVVVCSLTHTHTFCELPRVSLCWFLQVKGQLVLRRKWLFTSSYLSFLSSGHFFFYLWRHQVAVVNANFIPSKRAQVIHGNVSA